MFAIPHLGYTIAVTFPRPFGRPRPLSQNHMRAITMPQLFVFFFLRYTFTSRAGRRFRRSDPVWPKIHNKKKCIPARWHVNIHSRRSIRLFYSHREPGGCVYATVLLLRVLRHLVASLIFIFRIFECWKGLWTFCCFFFWRKDTFCDVAFHFTEECTYMN